ncbi:MAG TPA: hypothetical protein ENN30_00855 [Candidatus Woesearchaeota archaeon]|nr:hypothetical protein [Candidatus Woesearchaeota archaeon]
MVNPIIIVLLAVVAMSAGGVIAQSTFSELKKDRNLLRFIELLAAFVISILFVTGFGIWQMLLVLMGLATVWTINFFIYKKHADHQIRFIALGLGLSMNPTAIISTLVILYALLAGLIISFKSGKEYKTHIKLFSSIFILSGVLGLFFPGHIMSNYLAGIIIATTFGKFY